MDEIQENKEVEKDIEDKVQGNEVEKVVEDRWSHLPEEILCLINSNLFGRDYDVFGAVCKSWRSTPPPIDSPYRYSPCLMFFNRENYMSVFLNPLYNRSYSMDIPELYNAYILALNYGWLLVSIHRSHFFFFNPFTREKIELPDLEEYYHCWTFTSPPTSDDCLIIGISGYGEDSLIGILRRGQRSWEAHTYTNNEYFRCSDNPVLFNKLYYVLGINGNTGVFDLDKLTWIVFLTRNAHEAQYICRSFLAEDDGRLVAACLSRDYNSEVCLFNLGLTNMVWEVKQSIGDKAMYASCGSTFIKRGVDSPMRNKICFPFHNDRKAVLYCLADKSFYQFDDGECSPTETKDLMREKCNAWVEPNFESVGGEKLIW